MYVSSYEMGSGPAVIMSRQRVNDGQEHTIEVSKLGRKGTLTVDGGNEVSGESEGFLQMLNADGNIYIGMFNTFMATDPSPSSHKINTVL